MVEDKQGMQLIKPPQGKHTRKHKLTRKDMKKMKKGIEEQGTIKNSKQDTEDLLQKLDCRSSIADVGEALTIAYTKESYFYKDANQMLRENSHDHNLAPAVRNLNEDLILQGNKTSQTTWRGVNVSKTNPNQEIVNVKPGEYITFNGFTSTSTDKPIAQGFAKAGTGTPVLAKINGKSGVDVSNKSALPEKERLYPMGIKFKCTENKNVDGQVNLSLVQAEPPKHTIDSHKLIAPYIPPLISAESKKLR